MYPLGCVALGYLALGFVVVPLFTKIDKKEELSVMGVSDASHHHDYRSVAGELIMLGNQSI